MRSRGRALFVVLVVLLLLGFIGVVIGLLLTGRDDAVATKTMLELDLTQPLPEYIPTRSFLSERTDLRQVVHALEQASEEERVVGLVARISAAPMGLARIQEIRDAVEGFAAAGKKTVAFTDTFGEWGPGNGAYYLATAFEDIYLQPSGDIGLTGLLYQTSFLRGTLEKLAVEPRLDHRQEYKNAMNSLTEKEYTPAHEEAMQALVDSQFEQVLGGIAEGREADREMIRGVFDRGPYLGQEAVEAGLVERLAYRDEVYDAIREEVGEDVEFMSFSSYAGGREFLGKGRTVALIYGVGSVARGESDSSPFSGETIMGAETISEAFRDAVKDPKVEAILFRVDSPGGSYVASDTIWRETVRAREAGKPVVVSMGDLAGSGGYFVAMAADTIVAQPGTLTGSIGVYGGKLLNRGLWAKLGISFDDVASSSNARMWSALDDYSESGYERFQASLDRIYEDFVSKVAAGRDLPLERVRDIAKGRVWTGAAAKDLGLVDALGGYPVALAKVREALDLEEDIDLRLKVFPRQKSRFEVILDQLEIYGSSQPQTFIRASGILGSVVRSLRAAGLLEPGYGPLTMPLAPFIDLPALDRGH